MITGVNQAYREKDARRKRVAALNFKPELKIVYSEVLGTVDAKLEIISKFSNLEIICLDSFSEEENNLLNSLEKQYSIKKKTTYHSHSPIKNLFSKFVYWYKNQ